MVGGHGWEKTSRMGKDGRMSKNSRMWVGWGKMGRMA